MKDIELQANYYIYSLGIENVRGRERILNAEKCRGKGQIL